MTQECTSDTNRCCPEGYTLTGERENGTAICLSPAQLAALYAAPPEPVDTSGGCNPVTTYTESGELVTVGGTGPGWCPDCTPRTPTWWGDSCASPTPLQMDTYNAFNAKYGADYGVTSIGLDGSVSYYPRHPQGSGFSLTGFLSLAAGLLTLGTVGGLTTAQIAGNVETGADVNQNLGVAAGLDVAGAMAVGAAVAAPAVTSAASSTPLDISGEPLSFDLGPANEIANMPVPLSSTPPVEDIGGSLDVGATSPSFDLGQSLDTGAVEDLSGGTAPPINTATTSDLGGAASMPSSPAISSAPSALPTVAKAAASDLTTVAGAAAAAKAIFAQVQTARKGGAQVATTQSTVAATNASVAGGSAGNTGGLAVDYSGTIKALLVPVGIVLGAKFLASVL